MARPGRWTMAGPTRGVLRAAASSTAPGLPVRDVRTFTARGRAHGARGLFVLHGAILRDAELPYDSAQSQREVAALHAHGARHFRVGREPGISPTGPARSKYPVPRPEMFEASVLRDPSCSPGPEHPPYRQHQSGNDCTKMRPARKHSGRSSPHHTPWDVAAFGMETADPAVVAANNLKAGAGRRLLAIAFVNDEGATRRARSQSPSWALNSAADLPERPGRPTSNEQFLGTGPGCGPCGAAGEYPGGDAV